MTEVFVEQLLTLPGSAKYIFKNGSVPTILQRRDNRCFPYEGFFDKKTYNVFCLLLPSHLSMILAYFFAMHQNRLAGFGKAIFPPKDLA